MLIKDAKILVFDVETTGLDTKEARVVEFGAAIREPGEVTRRRLVINPGVPIPSEASRVHRITDDKVKDCPTFKEAWPRIEPYFEDRVACGYNAVGYDAPLVNAELHRHGFEFRIDPRAVLDVIIFVHYHLRHLRRRNLSSMCERYGIKPVGGRAHSAAVDCQMTLELLYALVDDKVVPERLDDAMRQQEELRPKTDAEYEKYSHWIFHDRKTGRLRIGAGQHCGKLMTEAPKTFYGWALKKMQDLTPETKRLFQAGEAGRIADEEMQDGLPGLDLEEAKDPEGEWGGSGRKP